MSVASQFPAAQRLTCTAFVVVALVLLGWGCVFRRLAGHQVRSGDDLFAACFEGWALLLGALQVWHFFAPVDARAAGAMAVLGVGGLALTRPAWPAIRRGMIRDLPAVPLVLAAAFWLSQLALGGPRHGDAGGYYIPTTLWMHLHPVVVGLGNLFAPYAYNESYFLYAAVLAVGPFATRPWHVANSALLMILVARGLVGWSRLLSPWHAITWTDLAYALLLPGELVLALGLFLTSMAPDTGIYLVGAGLLGSMLRVATSEGRDARFHVLAIVLYACAGWTIKIAFAGMAGALLLVVPLGWWWRLRPAPRELARTCGASAVIGLFMLLPWLLSNVMMSGSPFFPSALGTIDVPWRVHMDVQRWIESDKYVGTLSTLWQDPRWVWQRMLDYGWGDLEVALPLAAGGVALAAAAVLAIAGLVLRRRRCDAPPCWIVLPPLASLVFALRLTPMPRYAGATMWLFGIAATLVACGAWLRRSELARGLTAGAVVAAGVWLASHVQPLWPGLQDFETAPNVATDESRLASGLVIHVPRVTDACWAAPLPCAPHPDPGLALRRPGDLAGGFEIVTADASP